MTLNQVRKRARELFGLEAKVDRFGTRRFQTWVCFRDARRGTAWIERKRIAVQYSAEDLIAELERIKANERAGERQRGQRKGG